MNYPEPSEESQLQQWSRQRQLGSQREAQQEQAQQQEAERQYDSHDVLRCRLTGELPGVSSDQSGLPRVRQSALMVAVLTSLLATAASRAQEPDPVEEIVIFGRNTDLVGRADSASVGYVGGADLLIRPLVKTAELLESMPGMVAVQHSGSGKANQYFLRGFNLDHGTDYTVHLDGVPLNLRSHGHGQGYLDVNGVIPETVDGIDYRKGPYYADLGDFSLAGASFINTIDRLEQPFVSGESGENGWGRYVGGSSFDLADGTLTLIGEYKNYDGPWDHGEDLNHLSLWSKYLTTTRFGEAAFTLSAYQADWEPTEQIPERAIGTPVCPDSFCSLDPTAQGETTRWIAAADLTGNNWSANLYGQYYDWTMSSNPTYDAQINQFDKRWIAGGRADRTVLDNDRFQITTGAEFRYDQGKRIGVEAYERGVYTGDIAANEIAEFSVGPFVDATWYASSKLRVNTGLRYDYYDFDVTALNGLSAAGQKTDSEVSPKIGLAYTALDNLELYYNWGQGFHSNDARGVVNPVDPVPGLSTGTGYEVGGRLTLGDLKFTSAYWWLDQDSELIFVGDSNSVEPKGASKRDGYELTMFWRPVDWFAMDASFNSSDARYLDNPEGDYVEQAVEEAAQLGLSFTQPDWDASLRVRYLGPYALDATNSRRGEALTTANFRSDYHFDSVTLFLEVINLFDSDGKEIVYYYPAYVDGLDPPGLTSEDIDCAVTNCLMSRATMPRAVRAGIKYSF
ncbi:MAG: TonB-dependent receptor [Pseudomonadales bacterium]|nr:TonB-dependent receptor [Pseudomonadales bacterium]